LLSELGEDVVSQDISIASEGELAARSLLALVENLERSQEEHNVESESNTPAQSMMGEVANDVREWGERYNHLPGANDVVQAVATFGEPTPGWKRSDPRTPANEWREWWLDHTRRISELREAAKAFAAQQESDG